MEIKQKEYIRTRLQHGDKARIANILGITRQYVGDVIGTKNLIGRRGEVDNPTTKEVWNTAWILVRQKDELTHLSPNTIHLTEL